MMPDRQWRRRMGSLATLIVVTAVTGGGEALAQNAGANPGFRLQFGQARGGQVAIARFAGVTVVCQPAPDPDSLEGKALASDDEPPPTMQISVNQGNFDLLMFRDEREATAVRARLIRLLDQKIKTIDTVCKLTDAQKEKFRLAGRGDVKRLLQRVEPVRAHFENRTDIRDLNQFEKWARGVYAETEALWPILKRGPFDGTSLFDKTLKRTLTPEQAGKYARAPSEVLVAATGNITPALLEEVLREWERSSARIGRLDVEFALYRYDHTFEVEHRGQGALAVARQGRAFYKVQPATIVPGEVAKKQNRGGVPYQLKAASAERWHWTGREVIRVDEADRTFEAVTLPIKSTAGEFRPDPPELPDEPITLVPAAAPPTIPQPDRKIPQRPATLSEWITGIAIGVAFGVAISKIDFSSLPDVQEFWLARPFLVGMPTGDLRERFDVNLTKTEEALVWLEFRPKQKRERACFNKATLILDTDGYIPKALKMTDVTGTETVHVFRNVSVTAWNERAANVVPPGRERLDRANLSGYRPVGK